MVRALDLSLEVQDSNPHGGSRPRGGGCHMETATWCDLVLPRGNLKNDFLNLKKIKLTKLTKTVTKKSTLSCYLLSTST